MSKAYSNKALPHGTVLREWRLEEVLGVGGFGIVYKARGIYFKELVAIKEYFPSAISERDDDATVVPVDSDAEEVHALGLKKFVEEAKLLWNLSSPSRHPNIVSVRSLFEVHGTAYMVMDFEDGTSLSKLLKNGVRFNEASLKDIILPMAEGLERAHRVGVLHRDIKPPNIIINDSGKSVLIDFGSARFESGEATSTTVTFHTPPYAAIEQYVKTFTQGPWTDIYALGVVLYECVTGTKPPEVLERMHGAAGTPLAEGNWPGYSKAFLAAIDKAMMVRPEDRPRSIADWLPMLAAGEGGARLDDDDDDDEDVTRIMSFDAAAATIVPVAPSPPGFGTGDLPASNVPDDPKEVQFKKAGGETDVGKRVATEEDARKRKPPIPDKANDAPASSAPPTGTTGQDNTADAAPPATPAEESAPAASARSASPAAATVTGAGGDKAKDKAGEKTEGVKAGPGSKPATASKRGGMRGKVLLAAGALILAGGAGWAIFGGRDPAPVVTPSKPPVIVNTVDAMGPALVSLVADAREAGASAPAVAALEAQAAQVQADIVQLRDLPQGGAAAQLTDRITQATVKAATDFSAALVGSGQDQVTRAYRTYPWANPSGSARPQTTAQRQAAGQVRAALEGLRATANPAGETVTASTAIAGARQALERSRTLATAITALTSPALATATVAAAVPTAAPRTPVAGAPQQVTAPATPTARPSAGSTSPMTTAQRREISRIVDRAQDVARDVIRLEGRNRPGSNATEAEREGYAIRQADGQTAREYQAYLRTLEASLTNTTSSAEGDRMIQQANQTLGYLRELLNRSNATLR